MESYSDSNPNFQLQEWDPSPSRGQSPCPTLSHYKVKCFFCIVLLLVSGISVNEPSQFCYIVRRIPEHDST